MAKIDWIIPDRYNVFPEEERCMPVYRLQMLDTEDLYSESGWRS